jgi:hypothetical protein
MEKGKACHIVIKNIGGSVEHYYHFLLGFLVPLVTWNSNSRVPEDSKVYIRSCAILDRILLELCLPNLVILEKNVHSNLASATEYSGEILRHICLEGFDHPRAYSKDVFALAKREIVRRLDIGNLEKCALTSDVARERIIFINRKEADPFYQSPRAEVKTSGSMRRSIPNIDELELAFSDYGVKVVNLEGSTLREQVRLFATANVIIAQHGAALANLLFSSPGQTLIEILPDGYKGDCFRGLTQIIGMRHIVVRQRHSHCAVSADTILAALNDSFNAME